MRSPRKRTFLKKLCSGKSTQSANPKEITVGLSTCCSYTARRCSPHPSSCTCAVVFRQQDVPHVTAGVCGYVMLCMFSCIVVNVVRLRFRSRCYLIGCHDGASLGAYSTVGRQVQAPLLVVPYRLLARKTKASDEAKAKAEEGTHSGL